MAICPFTFAVADKNVFISYQKKQGIVANDAF